MTNDTINRNDRIMASINCIDSGYVDSTRAYLGIEDFQSDIFLNVSE